MLKFTNTEKTLAAFFGASFSLAAPEDWASIGDTPTREAVLAWLAAGNKPLPVDPIPSLPITGTKYKFRLALNKLGLRAAVETAVAASTNQDIKDAWVYADEFRSDDPLVLQLGLALGKTEAEIRAVFELANSL